jgi:NAD(P)-dependent dehydrogenase (short-subunit alcohol dehydrogenase family)
MKYSFKGSAALVSGGGSGIGEAAAKLLAANGVKVVVSDRDAAAAERVVAAIAAAGGTAVAHVGDVAKPETAQSAVDCAIKHFGALHLAFNNAGVGEATRPLVEMTPQEWQQVIDINLSGVMHGMRAQIPAMLEAGGGAIVNMSSILGLVGDPGAPAYVAAKHGVTGLTRSTALAYAGKGVRINSIHPGYIDTPMLSGLAPELMTVLVGRHAIGRLGHADEVAHAAVFLLSEGAGFMVGATLEVDGGYTAA